MKKILSVLLAAVILSMLIVPSLSFVSFAASTSHVHPVCGSTCTHSHSNQTWTAWDGKSAMYNGYYYLDRDVKLSSKMILNYSYSSYLCLNGHSITSEDTVFDIYSNRSLTITDCVGTGVIETVAVPGGQEYYPDTILNARNLTVWNGNIKNSNGHGEAILAGIYDTPSTTIIYGGNVGGEYHDGIHISRNVSAYIYGGNVGRIYLQPSAKAYIYDGVIGGNDGIPISGIGQLGVTTPSLVNISGGTVIGNFNAIALTEGKVVISGGYIDGNVYNSMNEAKGENNISGGTINGTLNLKGKTTVSGGEFMDSVSFSDEALISGGTFNGKLNLGYTSSKDAVFSITGGEFTNINANGGTLYLSGSPVIEKLHIWKPSSVSAQNKNGTKSYNGSDVNIDLHGTYIDNVWTTWEDGDVFIKNVASEEIAKKFVYSDANYPYDYTEYVNNSMVCRRHYFNIVVTDPTCTAGGYTTYTCDCGFSYVGDKVAASGHSYKSVVTAPTCTSGGYTTYTCSICGNSYVGDKTSALGHDYKSVVTAPTCTAKGYTSHVCKTCGYTYVSDVISAYGHKIVTEKAVAPTCTANGVTEGSYCDVCGTVFATQTVVPALEHDYIFHEGKSETCTEKGWNDYYTCGRKGCDYTTYQENPAMGHVFVEYISNNDATCSKEGTKTAVCLICKSEDTVIDEDSRLSHVDADGDFFCDVCGAEIGRCRLCGQREHEDYISAFICLIRTLIKLIVSFIGNVVI